MDWARVSELFEECTGKTPSGRVKFLRATCGDDDALFREVQTLLEAAGEAGEFLEPEARRVPDRAGPWKIVEKIGEGGIGLVCRAVRDDGEFEQEVAIKFLRRGADSGHLRRYFQSERRILAQLQHPNIARLLDGGVTSDGRPWFAMELVNGLTIDDYVRERGRRERLELFVKVCRAVQFAHRHLVVHRDIKPGNILVNAEGEPKLLDFGVAKILAPEEAGVTRTAAYLTPEYASPEQLRNEAVTTATDVYSLGVVLYEVLTGSRPYRVKTTAAHELAAAICEQDAAAPTGIRDLDLIVLTALEKDPARRYSSAEQFANDIRLFLDGYPITARKPTVSYRVGRFLRRNRLGTAAAALVLVSLVAGLAGTIWQYRIARAERAMVEQRFNELRRLSRSVLFEFHDAIADLPGATPARGLMLTRATEYLDNLAASKPTDPSLRKELAEAYLRAGDILGGVGRSNLGDTAGARKAYTKANLLMLESEVGDNEAQLLLAKSYNRLEGYENARKAFLIYQRVAEEEPTPANRNNLATSYYYVAQEMQRVNNHPDALDWRMKELAIRKELFAAAPERRDYLSNLALSHKRIGGILIRLEKLDAARENYEAALRLEEKWMQEQPLSPSAKMAVTYSLNDLSMIHDLQGRWREAVAGYTKSLAMREELAAADPKNDRIHGALLSGYVRTAAVLRKAGRVDAANVLIAKARRAERRPGEVEEQVRALQR